ncbi:hypothetical protein AB5N19_10593 [Seiridium cardinale]
MSRSTRRSGRVKHQDGGIPLPPSHNDFYGQNNEIVPVRGKKQDFISQEENDRRNAELYNATFGLSRGQQPTQKSSDPVEEAVSSITGTTGKKNKGKGLDQSFSQVTQVSENSFPGLQSSFVPARNSRPAFPQHFQPFSKLDPWNLEDEAGNRNLYQTGLQNPYQTPYNNRQHPSEPSNSLASKWGMADGRPSPYPLSTRSFMQEDQLYNSAGIQSPSIQPPTRPPARQSGRTQTSGSGTGNSPPPSPPPPPPQPRPSNNGQKQTPSPPVNNQQKTPPPASSGNSQQTNPPPAPPGNSQQPNPPPAPSGRSQQSNPPPAPSGRSQQSNPPPAPSGSGPQSNPPPAPLGRSQQTSPPGSISFGRPLSAPQGLDLSWSGSGSQSSPAAGTGPQNPSQSTSGGNQNSTTTSTGWKSPTQPIAGGNQNNPIVGVGFTSGGNQNFPTTPGSQSPTQSTTGGNQNSITASSGPQNSPSGSNNGYAKSWMSQKLQQNIRSRMGQSKPQTQNTSKPWTSRDDVTDAQKAQTGQFRQRLGIQQGPINTAPAWQKPQPPTYPPINGSSGNGSQGATGSGSQGATGSASSAPVAPPSPLPPVDPSWGSRLLNLFRGFGDWVSDTAREYWKWLLIPVLVFLAAMIWQFLAGLPSSAHGGPVPGNFSLPFWGGGGGCCNEAKMKEIFSRLDGIDLDLDRIHENLHMPRLGHKSGNNGRLVFWVDQDKKGKLVIPQDYYEAIKQQILKDKELLKGVSNETWSPIINRLVDGGYLKKKPKGKYPGYEDITTNEANSAWDLWVRQNDAAIVKALHGGLNKTISELTEKELKVLLAQHNFNSTDGKLVTRKEFEELYKKEIKGGYKGKLREVADEVGEFKEKLEKLKANPHLGILDDDLKAVVDAAVRKYTDALKIEAAAKAGSSAVLAQLTGQVNFFTTGSGALIDPHLTSRKWKPPKPAIRSKQWYDKDGYQPQPAIVALSPWEEEGECFCAGPSRQGRGVGTATLSIMISRNVVPQYLILEHILPGATLDPGARPRDIEIWANYEDVDLRTTVQAWSRARWPGTAEEKALHSGYAKIGEFTYEDHKVGDGSQVYKMNSNLVDMNAAASDYVVRALNNYGADHTCFYRIRLYGEQRDRTVDYV